MYTCVYTYIYIERERERQTDVYTCACMYMNTSGGISGDYTNTTGYTLNVMAMAWHVVHGQTCLHAGKLSPPQYIGI